MHTAHVKELMPDYASGKLSVAEAAMVGKHLQSCAMCAREARQFRETMSSLSVSWEKPMASNYFQTLLPRVRQRIERRSSLNLFSLVSSRQFVLPALASTLLLAIFFHFNPPSDLEFEVNRFYKEMVLAIDGAGWESVLAEEVADADLEEFVSVSNFTLTSSIQSVLTANAELEFSDAPSSNSQSFGAEFGEDISNAIVLRLMVRRNL
jgi:hypothetical protein